MTKPPIIPVLEHYGFAGLVDYGGWHSARCEFHGERNASARYNPDEGKFKCFSSECGIEGDVFDVVMMYEGVDFAEAKRRVASITGVDGVELREGPAGRSRLPLWSRNRLSGQQGNRPGGRSLLSNRHGR